MGVSFSPTSVGEIENIKIDSPAASVRGNAPGRSEITTRSARASYVFQCGNSDAACILVRSLVFPVTSWKNRMTLDVRMSPSRFPGLTEI